MPSLETIYLHTGDVVRVGRVDPAAPTGIEQGDDAKYVVMHVGSESEIDKGTLPRLTAYVAQVATRGAGTILTTASTVEGPVRLTEPPERWSPEDIAKAQAEGSFPSVPPEDPRSAGRSGRVEGLAASILLRVQADYDQGEQLYGYEPPVTSYHAEN